MFIKSLLFIVFCLSLTLVICAPKTKSYSEENHCDVGDLADEIASYESVVKDIVEYAVSGPFKGKTYDELAKFVDTFGPRPSGTETLERAIDYMINLTQFEDIEHITTEKMEVPKWTRLKEKCEMLEPRRKKIALLGLGSSVSTPKNGIVGEIVVVPSFDLLETLPEDEIKGKIVLYVPKYTTYGETASYRTMGASKAAQKGAVASLVKSVTPFSIYSPHTGQQSYEEGVQKIPAAAITLEDADYIHRIIERGEKVVVNLTMESTSETKTSRNTIIDHTGKEDPENLVIVSGHIDSWDVGDGAMDDGGGLFVSWATPVILKRLNLIPKRTIRSIFWTSEEPGLIGAHAYAEKHKDELEKINFIIESDEGTFAPRGLAVAGTKKARCIVAEILKLFENINASTLTESDSPGSDITTIITHGVPGASLLNANERYFWFHHSDGDTLNVLDPSELDLCAGFYTAVAFVIADLSADIPR